MKAVARPAIPNRSTGFGSVNRYASSFPVSPSPSAYPCHPWSSASIRMMFGRSAARAGPPSSRTGTARAHVAFIAGAPGGGVTLLRRPLVGVGEGGLGQGDALDRLQQVGPGHPVGAER